MKLTFFVALRLMNTLALPIPIYTTRLPRTIRRASNLHKEEKPLRVDTSTCVTDETRLL
jgi:hypothetical protein